jgi:thiamine transporter ThiT
MIGLALIYFIWKYFSELAFEFEKSRWGYALLGIATYYGGTFMGGLILGIIGLLMESDFPNNMDNVALNFLALPFGFLAVWGLYHLLKRNWSRNAKNSDNDSLDSDLFKTT